jgi:membrane protein DedA with SNARE-associated domain
MSEAQLERHVAPPKFARNLVVTVVVAALVTGWIGAALAPTLVVRHPLWLIGLNANNRYLILSTNQLDGFSFYAAALARRVVPTLAFYLLGYWYGERAVNWLEHREPDSGKGIRWLERQFQRSGWLVVAIAPMTITALLAGAARLRPSRLVPLVVVSIAARLVVLRQLGQTFSGPVDAVVRWIDRTRRPLLVLSLGSVALVIWLQRRQRRDSLEELTALDDDLE